ncbi:MAG: anthranilate synthase component I family protein [Gammaproteobacteria bacterium]|nr:MAG: anthranilate synthase component I family protein [Gammaproteobacteria bacterium]TLZ01408.1 MAG: anthranilate synthase component I family protein [Gammaproteobacteria bacterium]TLZ10811.1 MAG: anthranilate synthase component I family protein [Gammaproteobacteria bacterium]TLZ11575.1 MAG: anthranilate synthase component I family protein [Gammaproteobacteria bacterium]TLZ12195.1 MAG: anthranilate synthase component I family protein [Gammaproteobacteria bacterium]
MKLGAFAPRFLLESVEGGERLARYSFIGFGDALEVRLDGAGLRIGEERRPPPADGAELLAALRAALSLAPKPQPDIAGVPLAGGLVGYAGYDVVRYFERLPAPAGDAGRAPVLHYVAPRSVLVFDHLTRGIALLHAGTEAERQALRAQVVRALRGALPNGRRAGRYAPPVAAFPRADYMAGVRRTQQYIAAGDVYQLVLASRFSGRHELDPFQAYRALRLINPSPYMYYCALGDVAVVGSSPEALVKLNGRRAQLRPIAGTRPRSADAAVDQAREAQLLADPKENAEHVMLVDLARNDLGRVAEAGTVRVAPYRAIERYSHVMHIVSGVHGELAAGRDAFDLFAAAFPAGTLVGAPKVRAMQIIDELEPVGRGLYGGTVGYFGARGDMDHAITIRTLVFSGDEYSYQAGAGIVADSVPETEHEEVLAKSAALVRALELAEAGL